MAFKFFICFLISFSLFAEELTCTNKGEVLSDGAQAEEALKRLMEGNHRFAMDKMTYPQRNNERRALIASKQDPFAIVLGCSDSRVPVEIVFDQSVGDLFIVRVAGNVVGKTEFESIHYSLVHHHPKIIMVLGHEGCGAVKAVLENDTQGVETIANLIQPAVDKAKKEGETTLLKKRSKGTSAGWWST